MSERKHSKQSLFLAVSKDLVEERAQLTLLPGEVELGVVGQGLGQVQLDEPGGHFVKMCWAELLLTYLSREPRWPLLAAQVYISQCQPCCFLLPKCFSSSLKIKV